MAFLFDDAKSIKEDMIEHRRYLHSNAEVGFELSKTVEYIIKVLEQLDLKPHIFGNNGVCCLIGKNSTDSKAVLLRADTDALPIKEDTDLFFKSEKNMHGCGHDMHTAMLLGAAKILKKHESKLKKTVKLVFQPAEEILEGAKNMIENGILDDPTVEKAYMLHTIVNSPFKSGTMIISNGISAPSTDYFEIEIIGKGCHGAMVNTGVDPIITAVHIVTMLDTIKTREISMNETATLSIGCINAGNTHNVVPEKAFIKGTLRAFDENTRKLMKMSLQRICENAARALKSNVRIEFTSSCPCLKNDSKLAENAFKTLTNIFDKDMIKTSDELKKSSSQKQRTSGSEDFAYYSNKVPSLMIGISAGSTDEGYCYPLHHPKVIFNEDSLIFGAAALSALALDNEKSQ